MPTELLVCQPLSHNHTPVVAREIRSKVFMGGEVGLKYVADHLAHLEAFAEH